MSFLDHPVKGIAHCLLDEDLNGEPLHVHISEVEPGQRSHPPHQHDGLESIYMFAGESTLEIGDETHVLHANEVITFNPKKMHGLYNSGEVTMRYLVTIVKEYEF